MNNIELTDLLISYVEKVCDRAPRDYPDTSLKGIVHVGHGIRSMSHITRHVCQLWASFAPSRIHGPCHLCAEELCQRIFNSIQVLDIIKDDADATITMIRDQISAMR